jgi:protein phosphatase
MHSPEATIYCANSLCQAPNPESHRFCQQCRSPIPKLYLWAVGVKAEDYQVGDFLAERYLCKQNRIFLDTKPGLLPDSVNELPEIVEAYLRLLPFPLHVPQVYAIYSLPENSAPPLLLLNSAPIVLPTQSQATSSSWVLPCLEAVWQKGGALRQLNWLWQIASLWEAMKQENVTSSLLNPALLRVEGGLVRILELQRNHVPLSLVDLGSQWQTWLGKAHPTILSFTTQLCDQMIGGHLTDAGHLADLLSQAIAHCSPTQARRVQLATLTDRGPTRQRNEDACYPPSNTAKTMSMSFGANAKQGLDTLPMVVVCDGIGGHEGGNIASNLAISTVQQQLHELPIQIAQQNPSTLIAELGRMLHTANDVITQRNDTEHRHERQRMGTTLVMALGCAHELYLAHVGDSRAYRITRYACHQVTVDDDLASRETRMGYALYRDALQQPNSGSLVQALGMNPSSYLHPTVQRFVIDEDCLFLLCSDGLSDNDRVEENWEAVLLPVLEGKQNIAVAARQLVEIANEQNGHDNVTVGLLYCRVMTTQISTSSVPAGLAMIPQLSSSGSDASIPAPASSPALSPTSNPSTIKTQAIVPTLPERRSRSSLPLILLGLLALAGLGGTIAYFGLANQSIGDRPVLPSPIAETPTPKPTLESTGSPPTNVPPNLSLQTRILVNRSSVDGQGKSPLVIMENPTNDVRPKARTVAVGSVVEVVGQQILANQKWLQLKVCSFPGTISSPSPPSKEQPRGALPMAQPGDMGWVQEREIASVITTDFSPTTTQLGRCSN